MALKLKKQLWQRQKGKLSYYVELNMVGNQQNEENNQQDEFRCRTCHCIDWEIFPNNIRVCITCHPKPKEITIVDQENDL